MPCRLPRRPRPRVLRARLAPPALLLAGALLLLAPGAAPAQEPAAPPAAEPVLSGPDGPARFLIETLTVEGAKETLARIVAAETLLQEGETYTEADLRQAVARVHRLPFVVDATFALRKGSERDAYELVIQVEPARWFFFEHAARFNWSDFSVSGLGDEDGSFESQTGIVGTRAFLGRSGVVFGSTGYRDNLDTGATQIGYTQYDLFGRGVVATLFASSDASCCGFTEDGLIFGSSVERERYRAGLNLAVPLSRFHALQLELDRRWDEIQGPLEHDLTAQSLEARWTRDTSDDPLLPRQGSTLSAGLEYETRESLGFRTFEIDSLAVLEVQSLTAAFTATRHWPLTHRQSVSAGGRLALRTVERELRGSTLSEGERAGGAVSARHLFRIWTLRAPGNLADLYLDTGASYGIDDFTQDLGFDLLQSRRLELSTALIYRSQWGRLRLGLSYLGEESR